MILGLTLLLTVLQVGSSFAVTLNQLQADLNDLEQSVDELQSFLLEVRATNQLEFASEQHPRGRHPPRLRAATDPQVVYIQDRSSGLVLQYNPNNVYQVTLEPYNPAFVFQRWYVLESGFPQYFFIANSTGVGDDFMRVIAAGSNADSPLYLERPMALGLNLGQLWIFREADSNTDNPRFVVMNARSGLVWNARNDQAPGGYVQVSSRTNLPNEQFYFFN